MKRTPRSAELYEKAREVLPGGVTHGTRYWDPYPLFIASAAGSRVTDVDGNEYVDFWCGHGGHIFGHSYPPVMDAVKRQLDEATNYGFCHQLEIDLAKQITRMVPNAEMVRFPNTGTEATLYATRLARGYTGAKKIGKFAGGWHGGYDALHLALKPPANEPPSAGLTEGALQDTVVLAYNNLESVDRALRREKFAAVILEPVLGAAGAVPAEREFLKGLRELCTETGTLLVFDEVITGFRLAPGGAQEFFGVQADITCFGKILGGGFPIGCIAGPREIMECMDFKTRKKAASVYQGGTFCGNPVSLTAGLATLRLLQDGAAIRRINAATAKMKKETADIFGGHNVDAHVVGEGSIFCVHFTRHAVRSIEDVFNADRETLEKYHLHLVAHGVLIIPHHMGFLSAVHTEDDISRLLGETENFAKHLHAQR